VTAPVRLYCIGDTMLELINGDTLASRYQRTVVLEAGSAALGGAVWNAVWYFEQLGRETVVATHYGSTDRERVVKSFSMHDLSMKFVAEKRSQTDVLVVLLKAQSPAIYIAGAAEQSDIDRMLSGLLDDGVVVMAGSRNVELRRRILAAVSICEFATFVFSPSYTLYEYPLDEVRRFMRRSELTFMNEHEAEYLKSALGVDDVDLMSMPRAGGIITKGAHGATLFPVNAAPFEVPSVSGRQEDVIGAGEAFLCGFVHAYLADPVWKRAGEMGAEVAAQVVRDGRVRAPIDRSRLPALRG
jgi:sugar/nucleoside kinase (ribokinase family)